MEFVVVFLVCLLVLIILVVGLAFGRAPAYQPSRASVLALLKGIADKSTPEPGWALFLSSPITHDAELEAFRKRCFLFDEGLSDQGRARPGINGNIYDLAGRTYIAGIARELEQLIQDQPLTLDF
ncbi:hypothetical protein [Amphritea sp. HPY]|uniref:hypothetical protein n=1 Tax=Amphritea sp. HPY TaxID=3421652 RepID=UPI003D7C63B4